MDFTSVLSILGGITIFTGAIAGLGAAGSWIIKWIKGVRKPHTDLVAKVEGLGAQHPHYEKCLKNDQEEICELKEGQKVLFNVCLRLANNKNDEQDFQDIVKDIQEYLVIHSLASKRKIRRQDLYDDDQFDW